MPRKPPKFAPLLVLIGLAGGGAPGAAPAQDAPLAVCFAPGTPESRVSAEYQRLQARYGTSLGAETGWRYQLNSRWTSSATNPSGLVQGDPITLTWSVVPDGTAVDGHNYEPAGPSNLRARLAAIYGTEAAGIAIIQQVFDAWEAVTAIDFVYEPNDDGAALAIGSLPGGVVGVRGDIRLSGHHIDGNNDILAYNYYPNVGEMVLDTDDIFFNDTSNSSRKMRNVLAHEFGHGLGLRHVCPINQTKLMEPYLTTAFDGPQHDDVLAGNRHYGDRFEHNETAGQAALLGTLGAPAVWDTLSVDDNGDADYLAFDLAGAASLTATLVPVGSTYLNGAQDPEDGTCSAGTNYDSLTVHDLGLEILDVDGATVLDSANTTGAGGSETIASLAIGSAGRYYAVVQGGGIDSAQLYRLELELLLPPFIFANDFEGGNTAAWSSSSP